MSTVHIPAGTLVDHIPAFVDGNCVMTANAESALRAAIDWKNARGISQHSRDVFRNLALNADVEVSEIMDAVTEALSANSTRYGQSMMRRRGRAPLLALYQWVKEAAPHEFQQPRTVEREQRQDAAYADAALSFLIKNVLTDEQHIRLSAFREGFAAAQRA